MGVKCDFSDIFAAIAEAKIKVNRKMHEVGKEAVRRAVESGDYNDVTGRLRASNKYEVSNGELRIFNDAPYASDVEARGRTVITTAALEAFAELEKMVL